MAGIFDASKKWQSHGEPGTLALRVSSAEEIPPKSSVQNDFSDALAIDHDGIPCKNSILFA